jgi:rhombotail lipoprotein
MNSKKRIMSLAGLLTAVALVPACTQFFSEFTDRGQRTGISSSLVDYLYPKGEIPPPVATDIPHLVVPLRVGVAFVPAHAGTMNPPSEALKNDLLERVRKQFLDRKYIAAIEVIPETYLRATKGLEGMQQVARLYGVDVMALASYDQVAVTADTKLSLTYWTVLGAYLIKGTSNQTQTFVDTAVFDVPTRKLLFRAPGVDSREQSSTAIESTQVSRDIQAQSFTAAMQDMTKNLVTELDRFEQRLKTEPQLAKVEHRTSGGGAFDFASCLGLALVLGWKRMHGARCR